ncbi:pyrimidine utilization protein A [Allosediminivita pacifica]|uniref:Pyrimidine oxygenase n=1 Tax=Allosediminivita pacifica TaxID=1267769 RepID=A0A2T6ATT4_9RHOB|nr:pyrimidine utilization protein A [Allosediminivita pacifica]PTX47225.1 pyrimidine oxygenase [Allosediminivita pacifica]GGB09290.1 pyrimidine monooxygenase RutA [Allosediminivita pacifica]
MDIGVFLPNGRNGYMISTAAKQFDPTYRQHLEIINKIDRHSMEFGLAMVKFRGFGGQTGYWDSALEAFTLCAGLAAATENVKLFASAAILSLPPAITARMISTMDSIAPGRVGVNIVTGWQPAEYTQQGLWPGDEYFGYRYDYASEYCTVLRDLWESGVSNFRGDHFTMEDCRLSPRPSGKIDIVAAGQSPRGMKFAAEHADYGFAFCTGINTPTAFAGTNERMLAAAAESGRDVGAYVLVMIIAEETDALAEAKWRKYSDAVDVDALSWMAEQSGRDAKADTTGTAKRINLPEGAANQNMGTLVGSYESVARMLDEMAEVPGTRGIMLAFDDYDTGIDVFGEKIQPLMRSRDAKLSAA